MFSYANFPTDARGLVPGVDEPVSFDPQVNPGYTEAFHIKEENTASCYFVSPSVFQRGILCPLTHLGTTILFRHVHTEKFLNIPQAILRRTITSM